MKADSAILRANADWLADLRAGGAVRESALADLRALIVAALPYALTTWLPAHDAQFDALVEDVAQETLLRVLASLDSFENRSLFTTWVHKIAVRVALTELRRRRWKDVSLEKLLDEGREASMPALTISPGQAAEQNDMVSFVQRMIAEELTEKQRQAMLAVNVRGMPLEELAQRMGTTRNALYKLLHDARLRLKRRMIREGLTPREVLAIFEQG